MHKEHDLPEGPDSLTAALFRDHNAIAVHQVQWEGSFPPETYQIKPL